LCDLLTEKEIFPIRSCKMADHIVCTYVIEEPYSSDTVELSGELSSIKLRTWKV